MILREFLQVFKSNLTLFGESLGNDLIYEFLVGVSKYFDNSLAFALDIREFVWLLKIERSLL